MNEEELKQRIQALQIERGRDFELVLRYLRADLTHAANRLGTRQWAMYREGCFDSYEQRLNINHPTCVKDLKNAFDVHAGCSIYLRAWDRDHPKGD
jgi:hypothetical protein